LSSHNAFHPRHFPDDDEVLGCVVSIAFQKLESRGDTEKTSTSNLAQLPFHIYSEFQSLPRERLMSSLIFYTDREQIFVATDTLAVDLAGKPLMFTSKAVYLPHFRTVIAGTGAGRFAGDWAMEVNNHLVIRGILNLDFHTPGQLQSRWESYKSEYGLQDEITTTVYHFGLSEVDQSVQAFAYRSANAFRSEPLQHGYGLKPACTPPEGGNLVEHLPAMMMEQRVNESEKDASERLHIGGECMAIHLTTEGCNAFKVFQFHDYERQLGEIFSNFREDGLR
jgi:hypothetical protein